MLLGVTPAVTSRDRATGPVARRDRAVTVTATAAAVCHGPGASDSLAVRPGSGCLPVTVADCTLTVPVTESR